MATARVSSNQTSRQPAPTPVRPPAARTVAPPASPALLRLTTPAVRLGASPIPTAGGEPLAAEVSAPLEFSFKHDLSAVRVHSDAQAATAASRLSARAFTFGSHIFLGPGEHASDLGLMAHETAHVIQQQAAPALQRSAPEQSDSLETEAQQASAAILRGASFSVKGRTGGARVQRLGLSDILDGLANLAANVPGYTLLTVIIGRNPINQRVVERNFTNLLRGFMGLIPGGEVLFQVLNRYGVVQRLGAWVEQQMNTIGLSYDYLRGRFTAFTDSLGWRDIFSPGDVWQRAQNIFSEPITRLRNFGARLVSQAITWLKETFMQPLSNFCREIPGYTLVTVLLGRDPFTNAPVDRSALNVVRSFAEFIPGGTEKLNQLVESRALQRAYQWFLQETQARNLTWARVTGTFAQAWDALRLEDVLSPLETLRRMINLFRPLINDLKSFAGAALMQLLEFIFEAAMGAGGARILAILKRARATFLTIVQNPVGFLRNLLGAVGQGVRQFMSRILVHLQQGVIAWLTGPVARAGIQMPERWDLRGTIGFVLQLLGLTWARVRQKLVRLMGERAVGMLERGFQLLQEIREKGLVQALRDRVTEFFGQLREAALGSIKSFIQQRLVMAGITQLLSLLNPVGAVIQAIIKTYTTIQFFIQKINQILDLVESVVNSIAAIASGAIGQAANFVERTMARTIPVILDFLARFIGLGDVGGHVTRTIQGLQARVDQMLDRAVDWIRSMAQRLGRAVMQAVRGQDTRTPEEKQHDLDRAVRELRPVMQPMLERGTRRLVLRARMFVWKRQYRLTDLSADGGRIRATINPTADMFSTQEIALGRLLEPILQEVERLHLLAVARNRTSAQRLERAATAAREGGRLPSGMTRDEMVILMRRQGLLQRERVLSRGDYEIRLENRRRHVLRTGSYVPTHLPGMQDTPSRFGRGYRWFGSVNRRMEEGVGETAGIAPLREEVEVARHLGNLPAARVGSALVAASDASGQVMPVVADVAVAGAANVVSPAEITFGRMAPMATDASAGAGSTAENIAAATPTALQAATDVRHGSYAVIFNTLSAAMRQSSDSILKLPGRQGEALQAVAQAFDQWKAIVTPNPQLADSPAATQAAQRLQAAITRFLATTRGG